MGGGTPRAAHQAPLAAPTHFRRSCAPTRHSCAGRNPGGLPVWRATRTPPLRRPSPPHYPRTSRKTTLNTSRHPVQPTPTLFPNSSLPPFRGEVRWGVGSTEPRTKPRSQRRLTSVVPAPLLVIPAQAGTRRPSQFGARRGAPPPRRPSTSPHPRTRRETTLNTSRHPAQPTPTLFPNSSLPPFRGEVRWGVERREPRTKPRSQRRFTSVIPAPPLVIPAQAGTHARNAAGSVTDCWRRSGRPSRVGARRGGGGRLVPACAGMTGRGRRGGGWRGAGMAVGRRDGGGVNTLWWRLGAFPPPT